MSMMRTRYKLYRNEGGTG